MKEILKRVETESSKKEPTIQHLKYEINETKKELKELKSRVQALELLDGLANSSEKYEKSIDSEFVEIFKNTPSFSKTPESINTIDRVINQKWYAQVTIVIAQEYIIKIEALIDSGADLNCISEGIVPTKYFTKTTQVLNTANGGRMPIQYKLSNSAVCLKEACFKTSFLLSKEITRPAILGTPFLGLLYHFKVSEQGIVLEANGDPVHLKFSTKPE